MRRPLSTVLVLAAALSATFALAQARKGGGGRTPKKPPAAAKPTGDNPYDDAKPGKSAAPAPASSAAPAEATSAPAADAGDQASEPPATAPAGSGAPVEEVRTSPLNPRPEEFPDGGGVTTPGDLDAVLGEIAALRARVAAVSDTLFHSRIVLKVETGGDHARIGKLVVTLDEGVVYTAPAGFHPEDATTIYDHAVAPGRHMLGVEIDRRDDRGDSFRNTQQSRVALEVPENDRLETVIRIDDDSDMGADFPSSAKGSYDLRVRVRAKARH